MNEAATQLRSTRKPCPPDCSNPQQSPCLSAGHERMCNVYRTRMATTPASQDRHAGALPALWAGAYLSGVSQAAQGMRSLRARLFLCRSGGRPGILHHDVRLYTKHDFRALASDQLRTGVVGPLCDDSPPDASHLRSATAARQRLAGCEPVFSQGARRLDRLGMAFAQCGKTTGRQVVALSPAPD